MQANVENGLRYQKAAVFLIQQLGADFENILHLEHDAFQQGKWKRQDIHGAQLTK